MERSPAGAVSGGAFFRPSGMGAQIGGNLEGQQLGVLPQVQRVVGVAGLQQGAGGVPPGAHGLPVRQEVPHAVHQVPPLLDDVPPGGPDRGLRREGEQVPERLPVLIMELPVAHRLHVVGAGGPLGVDVEHQEAVVSVGVGDALHGLQRGVQGVRRGGGGVDADADQGLLPPGAQDVPILRVGVGHVEPAAHVIVRRRP